VADEPAVGETTDPNGAQVVLPTRVWQGKIVEDHPEIQSYLRNILPTVAHPDHAAPDPCFEDRTRYDAESDVLYLHVGEPQVGEGEETPEGHVLRYAPGTNRIVGLTVMGPRHILGRDGHVAVTVPETVETTAEDLAPALAAV
jgi:uncharacterized protein YuzE